MASGSCPFRGPPSVLEWNAWQRGKADGQASSEPDVCSPLALCCQMLVAAVAALWVFPAEPFRLPGAPQGPAAWLLGAITAAAAPLLGLLHGLSQRHQSSGPQDAAERGAPRGQRRVTAGRARVLGNMADLLAPLDPEEVVESETETGPPAPGMPGSVLLGGWGEEYGHPPGHGTTPLGSSLQEVVQGGTRQVRHSLLLCLHISSAL